MEKPSVGAVKRKRVSEIERFLANVNVSSREREFTFAKIALFGSPLAFNHPDGNLPYTISS